MTRENQHGQTIVRVQLTLGRGAGAVLLDTHGVLVFRVNGKLADYHAPLPPDITSSTTTNDLPQSQPLNWLFS